MVSPEKMSSANTVNVGINGFGRIGKCFVRALHKGGAGDTLKVAAINDLGSPEDLAHLLRHDSVHGNFSGEVESGKDWIRVNGVEIPVTNHKSPKNLPWADQNVRIALESTGIFRDQKGMDYHLDAGAEKVVISAPDKDGSAKMIVMGVNDEEYDPEKHDKISNASCTTNAIAPIAKVLHEKFGIVRCHADTVHACTAGQLAVDGPHKDPRQSRSVLGNIIPTTTGAAKAVERVFPELAGKFTGDAARVPVPDGSYVLLHCFLEKEVTTAELRAALAHAAGGEMQGILRHSTDELVSSDALGDPHSSIIDAKFTKMLNPNWAKVGAFYDNEMGYSHRLVDLINMMGSQ